MGFAKPIEQIFIKLSRYIYVSKRYYTRRYSHEKYKRITAAIAIICRVCNSNDNTGSKIRKANSAYYPEV